MQIKTIVTAVILTGLIISPVYAKNIKNKQLPPGLQKKANKGVALPPGWQKKLAKGEIMDKAVYQQSKVIVPVDSRGLITVRIEGKLIKLFKATREVVEVLE